MNILLNRFALLLISTFLLLSPSTATAGPWTKNAGQAYIKTGQSIYRATEFRTGNGLLIEGVDYLSTTSFVYAEVGILKGLHLQTYLPLMYSRTVLGPTKSSDFGLADGQLSVQASPLELPFPTAIRLEAKLPLYGPPATSMTPARGDQQVDLALWLSAGGSLYPNPLYFYLDLGYLHRSSWTFDDTVAPELSDGIVGIAQVGYTFFDRVTTAITSSAVLPFRSDFVSQSYITLGPSIFIPLARGFALEFDGYFTPYSRNSAAGWALGTGLSFQLGS